MVPQSCRRLRPSSERVGLRARCPQAAAAAHEVVPVVPPADPPQRAHLPAVQGQESLEEPQEAQEEIVTIVRSTRCPTNVILTELFLVCSVKMYPCNRGVWS